MRRAFFSFLTGAALAGGLLAGCQSPATRIRENPQRFAAYAPGIQTNVRAGRIAPGYTRDMVYVALGHPDQADRSPASGHTNEVWLYSDVRAAGPTTFAPATTSLRDRDGHVWPMFGVAWTPGQPVYPGRQLRVVFSNDRVARIEVDAK